MFNSGGIRGDILGIGWLDYMEGSIMIDPVDIDFNEWSKKETEWSNKLERDEMRDEINLTIHQDDPLLIEVMGVTDASVFTPVEQDMTNRTAVREIVLGNITVRIYDDR